MSDFVQLERLALAYGSNVVVEDYTLSIGKGELIVLLGPSGCGKTTVMRSIAGLLKPVAGKISIDGKDVTGLPPSRREVGLVFQSYALFPHLSVYENVAFGLRLRRVANLDERVRQGLATVGLEDLVDRGTGALSGGQQQRVALARSLVMEPKVLLLDEPLSNLDARLRLDMRHELQRVQWETGVTMVFVTHDQSEALAVADRIVVMRDGKIEQIGSPKEVYDHPKSRFVADFVGFDNIRTDPDGKRIRAWRPSGVVLGCGQFTGIVSGISFAGDRYEYVINSDLGRIKAEHPVEIQGLSPGSSITFDLPHENSVILKSGD